MGSADFIFLPHSISDENIKVTKVSFFHLLETIRKSKLFERIKN